MAALDVHETGQQYPWLEAQLQATLNIIPAHTWYALPSGALTFLNERCADYLGLPKNHPLRLGIDAGASWDSHIPLLHPNDHEEARTIWSTCLSAGRAGEVSFRVRNAEGGYRWFLSRAEPLRASDGTLLYWIGVNLEIEERKQAEFYLAEGERLAHMGSWVLDPAGFFPYWSHELFHIYGLDPAKEGPSLEGYLAIVHPQDREFMRSLINRMFAQASGCDVTKRIVRPDGEVRYVRCVAVPIVENGVLKRIVGTAIDVTEHEHLTQELQRREAYLAEAQRLSQTGSFGWRPDCGEIVWSEESYRIFEYDHAVKPTIDLLVQRVHPEDRPDFLKVIESASAGATQFEHTYRWLLPDGSVKHVHALAHALQDASGKREFVGAATDVTSIKRAEEELRKSEAYLAEAQRLSHMGSWVWEVEGRRVLHLSDEWYRIYGFDPGQGMPGWEQRLQRVHPEDREKWQGTIERAIRERSDYEIEFRILLPDGTVKWVRTVAHSVLNATGELDRFVGSSMDVTERKKTEAKIREQEIEVRQIVDLAPQFVSVFGPGRERLYANRVVLDYLGIGLDEWRQRSLSTHIHPDDSERVKACWVRALRSGSAYDVELRVRKHDGSYRWFLARYNPVRDDKGQILRWYVAGTDIEDRKRDEEKLQEENAALKRAEQKIREQEAELRQMLDLTPQYLAVLGADGTPIYANRASLDYIGMSLHEWLQRKQIGEEVHPDDLKRVISELDRALSTGSPVEIEERVRKGDGSFRWCLTRCNPVRDENGQITRLYLASTDIHDRKSAEERLQLENVALREEIEKTSMFEEIVGTSRALQTVLSRISKVAPSNSTVLITGETGTGKELVARAIHRRSDRSSGAFVGVNCAAIPRDLIASELFGHEKGAFTGATQRRLGRFELAGGGTIFLDEVGELPAETQIALLRVLQEHEFERVGGTRSIHSDVRVIAATNRDLQAAIAGGGFRSDLFYRLNVFPIEIPPLRDRREDIPLLVEYFIDRFARKARKSIRRVNKKTCDLLRSYPWPGNIRELQNVIERSVIVCETENFSVDESWLSQPVAVPTKRPLALSEQFAAQEKRIIEAALQDCGGRVFGPFGAAAKLSMPRSTLESKIRSLKINKNRFKTAASSKNH
jgi:PAS domain S-box-containing protein